MAASSPSQQFAMLPVAAKALLLVLPVAVIGFGYYTFFHSALSQEIANAQAANAKLQEELAQAQQRHKQYLALREALSEREAIDQQNVRVLPEEAEIPAFLADLHRLAEASGLRLDLVQPRPEEQEALYVRVPVSLELEGQYHQLVKFFYNASKLERAVSMEDLSLTNPTVVGEEVRLKVRVLATTFRRRDAESPQAEAERDGQKGKKG